MEKVLQQSKVRDGRRETRENQVEHWGEGSGTHKPSQKIIQQVIQHQTRGFLSWGDCYFSQRRAAIIIYRRCQPELAGQASLVVILHVTKSGTLF
jgi:hypothetical protein